MRPVLLDIDGFCSYRSKTTVDFREADFFVLVGPTGSGKSTVMDAMVFALYGTVPRWGDKAAVASALAPTATKALVRLVFDVGGQRYVVLRDVRRGGGKSQAISVREARLERFVRSDALGTTEDETVPTASGSKEVSAEVEKLLGLNFAQFTQSVALPQGEFAKFLHAKNADRQDILKNLLGYSVYDDIQRAAYSRSAQAKSKAETLEEQLSDYADATTERVAELTGAAGTLREFHDSVTTVAVPALRSASDAVSSARTTMESLATERALLEAVIKPDDVDELETNRQKTVAELESAEESQRATERHEQELRESLQTLAPRHELQRRLEEWIELGELQERMPSLERDAIEAERLLVVARETRTKADAAATSARDAAIRAAQVASEADANVTAAEAELRSLKQITEPAGIEALGAKIIQAREDLDEANLRLTAREDEQRAAALAVGALPSADLLAAAKSAAEELISVVCEDLDKTGAREEAAQSLQRAQVAADAASSNLSAAESALREAEHTNQAAALRAGLCIGDECPVCGHEIVEALSHVDDVDIQELREAVAGARNEAGKAAQEVAQAQALLQSAEAVRDTRLRRCEALRAAVAEHISELGLDGIPVLTDAPQANAAGELREVRLAAESALTNVNGLLAQRYSTEQERQDADAAVAAAREGIRSAIEAVDRYAQESRDALTALGQARDSVSSLSPPTIDDTAVAASWRALVSWADEMSSATAERLAVLQEAANDAADFAMSLNTAKTEAEDAAHCSSEEFTAASLAHQRTQTARDSARERINELGQTLSNGITKDETTGQLERVIELEGQLAEAAKSIAAARESTGTAREAVALAESALTTGRQQLQRLRDPLSQFGAPEVVGTNLATDWDLFVRWAAAEAEARRVQVAAQQKLIADAETRLGEAAATLSNDLTNHGIAFAEDLSPVALAERAPTAVAVALAAAEAALEHAKERRSQSNKMRREMEAAQEHARVAQMLDQLMRASGFPKWLIGSALDRLLRDASAILMELSGGQFELTRNEQDLLVIDHNDADMSRLVKTLSGGETFQASLALALALSDQVTSLSAAGANKLESIFLDEGFGTLDEATLDVVAGTLESLASSGHRMVGVITHVPALAERIPVRFEVNRDNTGSHIERVTV